jgi:hypothetical protein
MYDGNHQAKFGHEALAGGIAFEAMRKWEDSQRKKGKNPPGLVALFLFLVEAMRTDRSSRRGC